MSIPLDYRFRAVGQLILLVAVVRAVIGFTMSTASGPQQADQLLASTILMVGHSLFYLFGARFRAKSGAVAYLGIQGTLAASIGLFSLSLWLTIGLFTALGVQAFSLLRHRASAALVAMGSILGLAVSMSLGLGASRSAAIALAVAGVGAVIAAVAGKRRSR